MSTPLVVDLDGTLARTDVLVESYLDLFKKRPGSALRALAILLMRGKAAFKARIGAYATFDPEMLPYVDEVLEHIHQARAEGRPVYLATAADRTMAEAVAAHLDCFDGVLASEGEANLKGETKAARLKDRFGAQGFDYIGDSRADIPVWKASRSAFMVDPTAGLEKRVRRMKDSGQVLVLARREDGLQAFIRLIRPHQWVKNILVFVPLLAAHAFTGEAFLLALTAFVAFSLCASSVYIINDLFDLQSDRKHQSKRYRPLAAGKVKLRTAALVAPLLLAGALGMAATLSMAFLGVLIGYFALTFSYSTFLKRNMMLDVVILGLLYTLRIFAGVVALDLVVSQWMMGFSLFFFFALAVMKRTTELVALAAEKTSGKTSGRGYFVADLDLLNALAGSSGMASLVILLFYLNTLGDTGLYDNPELLWLVIPILLYWFGRALLLAHRGDMYDDPIVFATRDRISLVCGGLVALTFISSL